MSNSGVERSGSPRRMSRAPTNRLMIVYALTQMRASCCSNGDPAESETLGVSSDLPVRRLRVAALLLCQVAVHQPVEARRELRRHEMARIGQEHQARALDARHQLAREVRRGEDVALAHHDQR